MEMETGKSPELVHVLAIDDDVADAQLLRRALEEVNGFEFSFAHASTVEQAGTMLHEREVDVIFLDYRLGAETGLEVLHWLRKGGESRPVIAFTSQGSDYVARDLMQNGADDYLRKSDATPEVLRRTIGAAISRYHRRMLEQLNVGLVAELKKSNEMLEERNRRLAEFSETAHDFVDNVSHEFRTPLTVIKEFTSIILDGLAGETTAEQKEYLTTVLDRVDDLATMIDDMLDISKLEAGMLGMARRTCRVKEIVQRVSKTLERKAASNQVQLAVEVADSLPPVYCDPEKIARVIINLSVNAIKFSSEGGRVRLWARSVEDEGLVRLGVTDNGPGIDPDKVAEIFQRFNQVGSEYRTGIKGFGIGLNIARELVHLNLGDIDVRSELGKGSTFSFTISMARPRSLMNRYLDRIDSFRKGSSTILMILLATDEATRALSLDDLDRFIQHHVRKSDLVFRTAPAQWLLIAPSNQPAFGPLQRRLLDSLQEANRNRPGTPLPELVTTLEGAWAIPDDRVEFIEEFHDRFTARELVHA